MLWLSARWPKLPGRCEISQWTKIWGILLGLALYAGEFGKKMFWLLRLKNCKVGCIRNVSQKTECERSLDNPKRWRICISSGRWSAKLSGRDCEFEPTLRRESTVRRVNLSWESHGDREECRPEEQEDDAEDREGFWSIQGHFIYCHHVEPRVQLTCQEKSHPSFHKIYIIKRNSSQKKYTMRGERIGEKPKHHERKTNSIVLILQGKDGILYFIQLCARIRSDEKISKTALHLILFKGESKHTLSHLAAQRVCETKFLTSYPQNPGSTRYSQVGTWEKEYELRMWFWSSNFGNRELRTVQKTLEICLSETHALKNREAQTKDLSSKPMLISNAKRQWKRNERRS